MAPVHVLRGDDERLTKSHSKSNKTIVQSIKFYRLMEVHLLPNRSSPSASNR